MIMRGTTPRALTTWGALVVLGMGALLLPLLPTWAQQPARESPPAHPASDPKPTSDPKQDDMYSAAFEFGWQSRLQYGRAAATEAVKGASLKKGVLLQVQTPQGGMDYLVLKAAVAK